MTTSVEQDAFAVQETVKKALKQVAPKFDNLFSVDLLYIEGGRWHSVEVNAHEFLQILQAGTFETKQLVAASVFEINTANEDGTEDKVRFIYDFALKHTEQDPWRIS